MEFIKTLFADKLLGDEREPVAVFSIPGLEGQFGLYAPRWEPWKQLILVGGMDLIYMYLATCSTSPYHLYCVFPTSNHA
jgi:hypothetical protein